MHTKGGGGFKKEACLARALRIAVLLLSLSCLEHVSLSLFFLFLSSLSRPFVLRLSPNDLSQDRTMRQEVVGVFTDLTTAARRLD